MFNPNGKTYVKVLTEKGTHATYSLTINDEQHYKNWKKSLEKKGQKFISGLPDTPENRFKIK